MLVSLLLSLALAPQRRTPTRAPTNAMRPVIPFVQTASNTLPQKADATFRAWPALNNESTRLAVNAGRRYRLHLLSTDIAEDPTRTLFHGDNLMNRFARALAERKAVDRKEFFEACEFFARVRSRVRADEETRTLVDVAGGHGLVGTLAAIFMLKQFDNVIIRDPRRPKAFDEVVAAALEVAPWTEGRISYEEDKVGAHAPLPTGCAVVCVHGCRDLTDRIIAAAAEADARAVALMPCCYKSTAADVPEALRLSLGVPLAADVQRTYTLERLGYTVTWSAIPPSITPMNRVILSHRPKRSSPEIADS